MGPKRAGSVPHWILRIHSPKDKLCEFLFEPSNLGAIVGGAYPLDQFVNAIPESRVVGRVLVGGLRLSPHRFQIHRF